MGSIASDQGSTVTGMLCSLLHPSYWNTDVCMWCMLYAKEEEQLLAINCKGQCITVVVLLTPDLTWRSDMAQFMLCEPITSG
jgi:hypothetical protein